MATKAMGSKKSLQLLLFQAALLGPVFCGNVLVWPTEGSHWLNMKKVTEELIHRGHSVTVLVSNASLFIKSGDDTMEKFEVYNVPFKTDTIETMIEEVVALWLNNRPTMLTFWQFYREMGNMFKNWHEMNMLMCDAVLTNHKLMAHLQGSSYDLLLTDPVTLCGDLLALKLSIPFVYSLRFSPGFTVERHCGKMPAPPSYAPAALSELTDYMSFGERIKNILSYHLQDFIFRSYWGHWDTYYSKILADKVSQPGFSQLSCFHHPRFHPGKDALVCFVEAAAEALHNNYRKPLCNRASEKPSSDNFKHSEEDFQDS